MQAKGRIAAALGASAVFCVAGVAVVQAAPAPTVSAPSKIEEVLIYSTRAKVRRVAFATVAAGEQRVRVASLPTTVDPDTVQVEARGTRVERVEVAVARGHLPRQAEAEKLVEQLESIDDQLNTLRDERSVLSAELSFVRDLQLQQPPSNVRQAKPEGFFVDSWRKILRWVEARSAASRKRLRELTVKQRALYKARHKLRVAAQQLDLTAVERPQLEVTATIKGGAGKHKLSISYLVQNVTWRPSYDLRYDHRKKRVEAIYYADVTQRSGEDWKGAALRFSTARAMSLIAVPELPTWTLGRKRDFRPRPRQRRESAEPAWVAPYRPVVVSAAVRRLRALLGYGHGRGGGGGVGVGYGRGSSLGGRGIRPRPSYRYKRRRSAYDRRRQLAEKDAPARAEMKSPVAADEAPPPPPSPVMVAPRKPSPRRAYGRLERLSMSSDSGGSRWHRKRKPTERLPWTDVGYRPPYLPSDSPAASAEGYLFTLYAPGRHDVPGNGKKRRIPVLRTNFKVSPVYRLAPGISKLAYVMAELTNSSGRPILRGHANLFSGSMFSGKSYINTALPGHKLTLPLGVDDSLKVERHLTQRTITEGVLFKDDVTEYTVSLEIANHRPYAVTVDVRDQIPLPSGRKIEIGSHVFRVGKKSVQAAKAADERKPGWTGADKQGRVVWIGKVGGRKVKKISFSFRISRPKDWLLSQYGG